MIQHATPNSAQEWGIMNKAIFSAAALALAACSPQGAGKAPDRQAAATQRPSDKESEAYMW
jgi:hypothetical protein